MQRRDEKDERLREALNGAPSERPGSPESQAIREDIHDRVWELQASLAPAHQQTLEAHAEAEVFGKRTMAEILRVDAATARKRLERAREALAAAVFAADYTAADFTDGDSDA